MTVVKVINKNMYWIIILVLVATMTVGKVIHENMSWITILVLVATMTVGKVINKNVLNYYLSAGCFNDRF